ncbi:pyocin activator PrtN family protein [Celeribacter sp. PS-C1]|uniref:pyocin activator PrtN family protein n=1 Tax=Celeribacter sp. PS-C1 TaxID=2820813 RepID=UPI001CA4F799|nr:pyocin activator PrtN family protein [Celeribacter sp. PS-C1]MBW6419485.1 pyocin activator PrtN family protein [Celeribacter sp. PS-C1]
MTTLMLLLARHDGREEIPFSQMAREYFGQEPEALERKIKRGAIQIGLPPEGLKYLRSSNVPLTLLARYIQDRRSAAMIKMDDYATDVSS